MCGGSLRHFRPTPIYLFARRLVRLGPGDPPGEEVLDAPAGVLLLLLIRECLYALCLRREDPCLLVAVFSEQVFHGLIGLGGPTAVKRDATGLAYGEIGRIPRRVPTTNGC